MTVHRTGCLDIEHGLGALLPQYGCRHNARVYAVAMRDSGEMKRMSYSGGTFVTSDEVADALVHFVAIVPRNRRNQVVVVPGFDAEGMPTPVALVLGPTSQIMSQHEVVSYAEPETQGVAEKVREQAQSHENTARIDTGNGRASLDYDVF